MLAYQKALQVITQTALSKPLGSEQVPLAEAVGRVCAENLYAALDIQPFDNSAMDGFAVRMDDLAKATDSAPVRLRKAGVMGAGKNPDGIVLQPGTCWHVMTGAPLPMGTEAIIPVEHAMVEGDEIVFQETPEAGQHIRSAGEDFKRGDCLLSIGERISPTHILPLATLGIAHITVFKKPRILFIPTGTEIVDDLGTTLQHGEIYNSNKFYAKAFLTACGADVFEYDTIRDDLNAFHSTLQDISRHRYDMIVSSGAVSAGSFDFIKDGLVASGADILYHKLKLKPGKPNLLAILPSGEIYFGLPGNPVATAVGLRFFVAAALRVMQSQEPEVPIYARAINEFSKKSGLHMVLKGRFDYQEDGSMTVNILDGQESFKVNPFLSMNCWIHVSEEREHISAGEVLEVYPLGI